MDTDLQIMGSVDKRGQSISPVVSLGSVFTAMIRQLNEPGFDCPEYTGVRVYTSKRITDMEQS